MVSDALKFRFPGANDLPNGNNSEGSESSDQEVNEDVLTPRGLRKYVQAVKDLQYMREFRTEDEPKWDPFIVSTDKHLAREVLIERMRNFEKRQDGLTGEDLQDFVEVGQLLKRGNKLPKPTDKKEVDKFGGTRTSLKNAKDFRQLIMRVGMATFGGAFLVGPMIIMVLIPGLVASILTTSLCVFGFGLIISFFFEWLQPFEVLSATAAYAAVLVVFVGTSN